MVYFAAERTLLAWVNAGLGLMALGFVVDRFDLILAQIHSPGRETWPGGAFLSWIGIVLILFGVAVHVTAAIRYVRFEHRYHRDVDTRPGRGLSLGVCLTLIASVMGLIIAVFLILTMG